jgi:two-component system, cell cycle response regulator DivK
MDRRQSRNVAERPLVLIVESHEDTRALYAIGLSSMGFEVIAESDSANAYGRAWKMHPDVIVADVTLRRRDGWELLHDLKQDPRTRDIPVVVITSDGQPVVRERVEQEQGTSCLLKPCLPDALAVELRHVLAGRSL